MIRGTITAKKANLNNFWPKAFILDGDFDAAQLLIDLNDLAGLPATGVYAEPLEDGWGDGPENLVLTGTDGEKSFIVVYPNGSLTGVSTTEPQAN